MFLSYKYLSYNAKTEEYRYQYKIIDSEFEEVAGADALGVGFGVGLVVAVIDTYEKRNLNVAANLVRAIMHYNKQHPNISVQQIIEYNKKYTPKFAKYETDLQKYLCLL